MVAGWPGVGYGTEDDDRAVCGRIAWFGAESARRPVPSPSASSGQALWDSPTFPTFTRHFRAGLSHAAAARLEFGRFWSRFIPETFSRKGQSPFAG